MSIPVELADLADAMQRYRLAYLLTVDDAGRAHAVSVAPRLVAGGIVVGDLGRRTAANLSARPAATLLWPPVDPAGYSLIVDGRAAAGEGDGVGSLAAGEGDGVGSAAAGEGDGVGSAAAGDGDGARRQVTILPSRAVLHRSAMPAGAGAAAEAAAPGHEGDGAAAPAAPVAGGPAPGCVSDCVEIGIGSV